VELGGATSSGPESLSSDSSEYSVHSDKELKSSKRFIFSIIIKNKSKSACVKCVHTSLKRAYKPCDNRVVLRYNWTISPELTGAYSE
jgi:hypothetical protein